MEKAIGSRKKSKKTTDRKGIINHLLVIGINKYKEFMHLNNACRDAETFKEILVKKYQFQKGNVKTLFDKEASREKIIEILEWYGKNLKKKHNLIIYFSGHGDKSTRSENGYWVPHDAKKNTYSNHIRNSEVKELLEEIGAHHIYLIVDSCFSGLFLTKDPSKNKNALEAKPSRRALTSGRNQVVSDGNGKHSPFAAELLLYLEDATGSVDSVDLEITVRNKMVKTEENQIPDMGYIKGLSGGRGQFFFHLELDDKKDWEDAQAKNSYEGYMNFLEKHPNSKHAREAKDEADWIKAEQEDDFFSYKLYIENNPDGNHITEAKEKYNKVLKTAEGRANHIITELSNSANIGDWMVREKGNFSSFSLPNRHINSFAWKELSWLSDEEKDLGLKELLRKQRGWLDRYVSNGHCRLIINLEVGLSYRTSKHNLFRLLALLDFIKTNRDRVEVVSAPPPLPSYQNLLIVENLGNEEIILCLKSNTPTEAGLMNSRKQDVDTDKNRAVIKKFDEEFEEILEKLNMDVYEAQQATIDFLEKTLRKLREEVKKS